jgi:hypothetical protein
MSTLSLLSAVAAIGMADPFSDSGIPSRRIYTLTGQTAQAWSRFLDRAAVAGDPYTMTERPGALEAARAFLSSIPVDRLSRARKATVAKLIRHLESPMSRHSNPEDSASTPLNDKILLPFKLGYGSLTVAELLQKAAAKRGEPISEKEAAKRAKGFRQGLLIEGLPVLLQRLKKQRASGRPMGWVSGPLVIFNASHYIRIHGRGGSKITPEGDVVFGDDLLRTLPEFRLQDIRFADPDGTLHDDEDRFLRSGSPSHAGDRTDNPDEPVRILRTGNPAAAGETLQTVRRYFPSATVSRTDSDGSRRSAYVGKLGPERGEPGIIEHGRRVWVEPGAASVRIRVYRFADPRRDNTLEAMVLTEERVVEPSDLGAALAAVIAKHGAGTRTGNPADDFDTLEQNYKAAVAAHSAAVAAYAAAYGWEPIRQNIWKHSNNKKAQAIRDAEAAEREAFRAWAGEDAAYYRYPTEERTDNPRRPKLVWEFDGEPTSPAELLSNNRDNGDVAAAVKYLAAEGAKFVASARSWAAVSFGGGASDESYLTVRADWTAGPVFAAVLDASVIPYAGDLPDAD